jgi:hypothetical protein
MAMFVIMIGIGIWHLILKNIRLFPQDREYVVGTLYFKNGGNQNITTNQAVGI